MPLKHAVLALVAERRGHGYDLVQRLEERIGPGWRLNPSAVYPALDQLERAGLVAGALRRGGTRRSPRIVYAATSDGVAALDAWLSTPDRRPEPVRSELHLRLAFAERDHQAALLAQLTVQERACAELLAHYPDTTRAGVRLIDLAVVARLRADLAWLGDARAEIAARGPSGSGATA